MEEILITQEDIDKELLEQDRRYKKASKAKNLKELFVKHNNVTYNADEVAQNNMTSVTAIANWQFNKKVTDGLMVISQIEGASQEVQQLAGLFKAVYNGVYKDNNIQWKNADDNISNPQVESIAEALHKAMLAKAEVILK